MHCNYVKSDSNIYISKLIINITHFLISFIAYPIWDGRSNHKCMTNKTKQNKNQLKENTLELVGCYDQLSHNTCGSGDGATTNKSPRRRKTKLFKCVEPHFNPFLLLGQSPFDNRDGNNNNKTNGGWKKDIKSQWKLKSQLVLISSTTTPFSSRDDRKGKKTQKIYSNFVKAIFVFKLATASSIIGQN